MNSFESLSAQDKVLLVHEVVATLVPNDAGLERVVAMWRKGKTAAIECTLPDGCDIRFHLVETLELLDTLMDAINEPDLVVFERGFIMRGGVRVNGWVAGFSGMSCSVTPFDSGILVHLSPSVNILTNGGGVISVA